MTTASQKQVSVAWKGGKATSQVYYGNGSSNNYLLVKADVIV